jgi:hypothetical protein
MYPHPKRRRLTGDVSFPTDLDNAPPPPLSSPPAFAPTLNNTDWTHTHTHPQRHAPAPAYTPSDSTDGPAFPSPLGAASWGHDGFSHDPGFLASQEELRCMLFTIAQSAAPTRAASPDADGLDEREREGRSERNIGPMRSALSSRRRVEYLKNYVGQVAPWVSDSMTGQYGSIATVRKQRDAVVCSGYKLPLEVSFGSCNVIS